MSIISSPVVLDFPARRCCCCHDCSQVTYRVLTRSATWLSFLRCSADALFLVFASRHFSSFWVTCLFLLKFEVPSFSGDKQCDKISDEIKRNSRMISFCGFQRDIEGLITILLGTTQRRLVAARPIIIKSNIMPRADWHKQRCQLDNN